MIDIYTIYCYYFNEEVIDIKAKVGIKAIDKWRYFIVRGDFNDIINEINDLMHDIAVTQITIKFYYEESKKNV